MQVDLPCYQDSFGSTSCRSFQLQCLLVVNRHQVHTHTAAPAVVPGGIKFTSRKLWRLEQNAAGTRENPGAAIPSVQASPPALLLSYT